MCIPQVGLVSELNPQFRPDGDQIEQVRPDLTVQLGGECRLNRWQQPLSPVPDLPDVAEQSGRLRARGRVDAIVESDPLGQAM